jgi:pimeloyl-ACP methyl ester carboxylesterase
MNTETKGQYASVNGLNIYYEIHGNEKTDTPPLVLLHGGVGGIEMFGPNLPAFAMRGRVIAVDLQGHGRTADIDRPIRFELMADDIAALIEHLGIGKADLLGYSLGGGVAMQTAIRHPDVIRRLVIASEPCKRNGWYPEVLAGMQRMNPAAAQGMKHSPLSKLYPDVDWASLFTKLGDLLSRNYDWSNDVAKIKAPVMLVFADADAVQLSHVMEFFALFGGGQRDAGLDGSTRPIARLAILPGFNHYNIFSTTLVAEMVGPFLDETAPTTEQREKPAQSQQRAAEDKKGH